MTVTIGRRELLAALGGAAAAWPLAAWAQQGGKVYRIGFIGNDPTIPITAAGAAFVEGLRENGFAEAKNIVLTSAKSANIRFSSAQFVPVPADADFRTGDHRAISAFTKRPKFAGVRSPL